MITFLIGVAILIVGYFVYGTLVERVFQPDDRPTPAVAINDGIDFVPMATWRIFLIQLLNIAGLGPIFGAISGALWGPSVYLWIVFGTILAGGVHDYISAMQSERNNGASISEIAGYACILRSSLGYGWNRIYGWTCWSYRPVDPRNLERKVLDHRYLGILYLGNLLAC